MSTEYPPPPAPPEPQPPSPKPKRIHPLLAAVAGAVIGAGAVGGAWASTDASDHATKKNATTNTLTTSSQPQTFTLTGTFELNSSAVDDGAGGCKGSNGYDDIFEGAEVTVYDAAGSVIATGYLGSSTSEDGGKCSFDVSVADVPKGKNFYKVEVSHRGTVQLTEAQAESGAFAASLG
ncbi:MULTISPECIES: hypothetical protein [unclassified Streptomyces]|uniref:hypothetical protein n=1 Tax=unclassified Streptomyces TaxID=2593676 RepID=UPI003D89E076